MEVYYKRVFRLNQHLQKKFKTEHIELSENYIDSFLEKFTHLHCEFPESIRQTVTLYALKWWSIRRMRYVTALMKWQESNFQLIDACWKFIFLKILQNSQESNCAEISYLMKLLVVGLETY